LRGEVIAKDVDGLRIAVDTENSNGFLAYMTRVLAEIRDKV